MKTPNNADEFLNLINKAQYGDEVEFDAFRYYRTIGGFIYYGFGANDRYGNGFIPDPQMPVIHNDMTKKVYEE